MTETMRAAVCTALTGPSAIEVQDIERPTPGAAQVTVDVAAASLNFPDVLMTYGKYQMRLDPPFTVVGEGAGTVRAVGAEVTHLTPGQRVLFMSQIGAAAETVAAAAQLVVPIPDSLDLNAAAGLTITYATTIHALKDRAHLQSGDSLLVLGAGGGVGLAAVELGKAMGARVIAAASTDAKLEAAKAAGADELINYSDADLRAELKRLTAGRGVDVTYDPVGGEYTETAFRSMAPGGRHLVIGFAAGDIPALPLNLCLLKQASLVGVFWGAWAQANPKGQIDNMKALFAYHSEGKIKPRTHAVYGLDDVQKAFADLTERRAIGKVLLKP